MINRYSWYALAYQLIYFAQLSEGTDPILWYRYELLSYLYKFIQCLLWIIPLCLCVSTSVYLCLLRSRNLSRYVYLKPPIVLIVRCVSLCLASLLVLLSSLDFHFLLWHNIFSLIVHSRVRNTLPASPHHILLGNI